MQALGLDEVWWLVSPGNPLKQKKGMAPIAARFKSARDMARRSRIVPTVIEQQLNTRYTAKTLKALTARYPAKDFIWLMGSDNLAQFHLWRDWRSIARTMPIAVIARPGYDRAAMTSPAMAWFRRYRVSGASISTAGRWSVPKLVYLRFDPDNRSATALRRADPDWALQYAGQDTGPMPRDPLTHQMIKEQSA